jgi:cytochrome c oxidase assembly factor CtaG
MYFVFAPQPLYSYYADLTNRPFGMTALGDQQIAGAVMWVPVLFLVATAFSVFLYKAIGEDEDVVEVADNAYGMPFAAHEGSVAHPVRRS